MDFPGGSITNIHVTDEFSNIYWRIYTEEPSITNNLPEAPANGYTILKHLGRLKEFELRLRNLDCLASCYPRRLGLWVFSATPDFERLKPFGPTDGDDGSNRIVIGSSTLKASASGTISSADLVKNLTPDPGNVYPAGSQKSATAPTPSKRVDGNFAAIYASFISAVTGAISLQFIRRNGAVPLGSRTLFTAVEEDGYSSPMVANDSPTSITSLTALQVQLTSVGKLTISLQTLAQPGITRLRNPWDLPTELIDAESGTDLWLSPNGTIARLVTANPDSPAFPSPNPSNTMNTAKRLQWKLTVLEWLENYGLPVNSVDGEMWAEVEVWEPFYAKLAGEVWQQTGENQASPPLKRILWPARYCFRRTNSISSGYGAKDSPFLGDPLEFAAQWYEIASSAPRRMDSKPATEPQPEQPKGQAESPLKSDFPEGIESLARMAEYPDLQSASLVYPTPPDGPPTGFNHLNPSDTIGGDSDIGLSQLQQVETQTADDQPAPKDPSDPDITMDFGPSAGLVVGSGLYDTNEDDDLFGDMNGADFDSKGITDADFNFFDDPDFGGMEDNNPAENIQEAPKIVTELEAPEPSPTEFKIPEGIPSIEVSPGHVDNTQADSGDTPAKPCEEGTIVDASMGPPNDSNQTISPPLSPVEVKKILFPGAEPSSHPGREAPKQNHYHYSPVTFDRKMSDWDRKYGSAGKFRFSAAPAASTNTASDIPTIGMPSRSGKNKALTGASSKLLNDNGTPSSGIKQSLHSASSSSSDTNSDDDEVSSENDSRSAGLTLKRKRARSNSENSAAPSLERLARDIDQENPTGKVENSTFLGNFLSIFSDWPLTGYFSASQNQVLPVLFSKEDQVQIAQLLTDQITQSSLTHGLDGKISISDLGSLAESLSASLEKVAPMGEAEKLDLKGYYSLQDGSHSHIVPDDAARAQDTQRKEGGKGLITKVVPPHLRVRRGKDYLEALPPLVLFWETFGIEPAHGPKDVSVYCIHPSDLAEPADTFLESFGLLYSSCNLGGHVRGSRSDAFKAGLASWNTKSSKVTDYSMAMQSLKALCEKLGTSLLQEKPSKEIIVIYIINPFTHAAALADICAAFWHLFQTYAADLDRRQAQQLDDLVLQVIPMRFLASPEFIVVPSQAEYLSLALEVYSRCPPRDPTSCLVNSAPPTLLAEALPKNITFKLSTEKLSPLLEGRTLHVACSRSLDQRWITAAWTDNTGSIQHTISYCLRFRDVKTGRSVMDIRKEIWTATRDIIDRIQARWKVVIANTEPLDQDEVDTWASLAEQHNKARTVPIELVIVNANTMPDLYLEPPPQPMPLSVLNAQPSSTPVATPNAGASVPSPDQPANSPTPASGGNPPANAPTPTEIPPEAESESLLTDVYDESWIVVLSHRLNCSLHLTEYRPALASGHLLRRRGPTDGDGVFSMTVNLIYTQRPLSAYETLLGDILKMYRDLATLSRAKGTHNVQHNTLPWHIAAAVQAQETLSYVL